MPVSQTFRDHLEDFIPVLAGNDPTLILLWLMDHGATLPELEQWLIEAASLLVQPHPDHADLLFALLLDFYPPENHPPILQLIQTIFSRCRHHGHAEKYRRRLVGRDLESLPPLWFTPFGTEESGGLFQNNLQALQHLHPWAATRLPPVNGCPVTLQRREKGYYFEEHGQWLPCRESPNLKPHLEQALKNPDANSMLLVASTPCHLLSILTATHRDQSSFLKRFTLLVVVPFPVLVAVMGVADFKPLLRGPFLFRFIDHAHPREGLDEALQNTNLIFPTLHTTFCPPDQLFLEQVLDPLLQENVVAYNARRAILKAELDRFYTPEFPRAVCQAMADGTLTVSILASRYSTYLQYCARDLQRGFVRLGVNARLITEKENESYKWRDDYYMEKFVRERPHLLVLLANLRPRHGMVPPFLPVVSWVQDQLPEIRSGAMAHHLSAMDFLFTNTFFDSLVAVGYRDLQRLPPPVNEEIFHGDPRQVAVYDHSILFVGHRPSFSVFTGDDAVRDARRNLLLLQTIAPDQERIGVELVTPDDYANAFPFLMEMVGEPDDLANFWTEIQEKTGNYLQRCKVLNWLLAEGLPLSLYGMGWQELAAFRHVGLGAAANGPELGHLYRHACINLMIHPYTTTHQKVFEIIASGGFLMVFHIPEAKDPCPITQYLQEGEGFVFFRHRKDFLEKVRYYLDHPEERIRITEAGQPKVLAHHTFRQTCQQILQRVQDRYCGTS